jgi:OOP family OmpA-OmpF porin
MNKEYRMNKIKTAALAAVVGAAVAFPTVSMAQMKGSDSGWYIGGNIGQADVDELNEKDTSFKILGGYQINRNFAAELGYTDFGKVETGGVTFKGTAWELVGVGSLPLSDKFSVFGKLGFAMTDGKATGVFGSVSDDSTDLTYGIGVKYNFTPTLGVTAEYQMYPEFANDASDVSVMSIGVVFRFR